MTAATGPAAPLLRLGDHPFVSLVTYRASGEAVATPVWVVRDGDSLLVSTPAASGKVRRLGRNPSVSLVPCGRFGAVERTDEPVHGTATIHTDPATVTGAAALLLRKYGWEYRSIMAMEQLGGRDPRRVVLRITGLTSAGRPHDPLEQTCPHP